MVSPIKSGGKARQEVDRGLEKPGWKGEDKCELNLEVPRL